ncbi:hypothetical protein V1525DRAFT_396937 [Lipomyces kononenkoae]|uniref:Uncharacterized protein n=1 Tax=Lipomyces kononenkoae TaxID=34357 RepID=A0ACC3T8T8_LIPKO
MASDSTTTTFIACIVIGFLLIRWFVIPSASPPSSSNSAGAPTSSSQAGTESGTTYRRRRPVTQAMIEVVQSIAPTLTVEQIRYDLERTGSVELTIDRILAEGGLPLPPNAQPEAPQPQPSPSSAAAKGPYSDLIARYKLQTKLHNDIDLDQPDGTNPGSTSTVAVKKAKWSQSKEERQEMLRQQRENMILRARRKLEEADKKINATE